MLALSVNEHPLEVRLEALFGAVPRDPDGVLRELNQLRAAFGDLDNAQRAHLDALATWLEASARVHLGELREALDAATLAARLATRAGAGRVRGGALSVVALCFHQLGHFGPALQHYDDAIAVLTPLDAALTWRVQLNRAGLLRKAGRLEEAALAFDALLAAADTENPESLVSLLINAASCWRQVSREDDAWAALRSAEPLLATVQRRDVAAWWHAVSAQLCTGTGSVADVVRHARTALAVSRPQDLALRSNVAHALARASALPDAGEDVAAAAEDVLGRVAREALERPVLGIAQDAHQALADLAERRGDPVSAVRHLREVQELSDRRRDESERLRLQAEDLRFELLKQQLESDHLRARMDELAAANRALLETDNARTRLLQSVAHDLRGPLTAIVGCADLLEGADPMHVLDLQRELVGSAYRMTAMIDRALSDATILRGTQHLVQEQLDLRPWLERAVFAFGPLAARRHQTLTLESPGLSTTCDPFAFSRIVDNLIGNALKYVPEGGRIEVSAELADGELRISVTDNGPGFRVTDPSRALLLGEQLSAPRTAGRGIGLHNVYDLASRLGGVVELGDVPTGGARVRVRLPAHPGPDQDGSNVRR